MTGIRWKGGGLGGPKRCETQRCIKIISPRQKSFCQEGPCVCAPHSEMDVFVTRTPPDVSIEGGPSKAAPSPSAVAFSFATHVLDGSVGAPVVATQCLLQPLDGTALPQVPPHLSPHITTLAFQVLALMNAQPGKNSSAVREQLCFPSLDACLRRQALCKVSHLCAAKVASVNGSSSVSADAVQLQSLEQPSAAAWANCTSPAAFTVPSS